MEPQYTRISKRINLLKQGIMSLYDGMGIILQVNLDMTDHYKTDYSSMTDKMLGPSPMHIKYLPYVYDGFCI